MPDLSLDNYRALLRDRPIPNREQIADFVDHVCGKHSWYKHLPLTLPGVRFRFYLDPHAGTQSFEEPDGFVAPREVGDSDVFHYSMLPTREYRRRFATLNVQDRGAPGFALHDLKGTAYYEAPPGIWANGETFQIPAVIALAGSVTVTGVIHRRSSSAWLWARHFRAADRDRGSELAWPEESGGIAILDRIRDMVQVDRGADVDRAIDELISSERERQRESMIRQIKQMVAQATTVSHS